MPRSESRHARSESPMANARATSPCDSIDDGFVAEDRREDRRAFVQRRREAMESERRAALAGKVEKKTAPASRDDEINSIEEQLQSGKISAAASVGLKKRLASLRAAALREERAAKARAQAPRPCEQGPEPSAAWPPRASPQQAAPSSQCNDAWPASAPHRPRSTEEPVDAESRMARPQHVQQQPPLPEQFQQLPWQQPQQLPPQQQQSQQQQRQVSYNSMPLDPSHHQCAGSPSGSSQRTGGRRHMLNGAKIGASSAPWANDFSNEGFRIE